MKVVVIGANGQLGSDICRTIGDRLPEVDLRPVMRSELDVSDHEAIDAFVDSVGPDVLINCTGYHKTDEVERNADMAFHINAHAVWRMAQACRKKGARLIHFSTDYVFSGAALRPYKEEDGVGPLNVYGASKVVGEQLACLEGEHVTVFRVASLFGVAGSSGKGGNFIEAILNKARNDGELSVVDDIVMSPTATATIADVVTYLLSKEIPAGIFHLVNSGEPVSWWGFAEAAVRLAGLEVPIKKVSAEDYPTVARRPAYSALDNGRLSGLCGGIEDWESALRNYLVERGHIEG